MRAPILIGSLRIVAGCGDSPDAPISRQNRDAETDAPRVVEAGAEASPPAPVPVRERVAITDLPYVVVVNGHGPAEKDKSNGEMLASDGKPISLGGTIYERGLGVHARSEITVDLGGKYERFESDVGVDDEVPEGAGTVVFQVFVDDAKLFESPTLTRASGPTPVNVRVAGGRRLKLVVTDAGDGGAWDHGDWANPHLVK